MKYPLSSERVFPRLMFERLSLKVVILKHMAFGREVTGYEAKGFINGILHGKQEPPDGSFAPLSTMGEHSKKMLYMRKWILTKHKHDSLQNRVK